MRYFVPYAISKYYTFRVQIQNQLSNTEDAFANFKVNIACTFGKHA